MLSKGFLLLMCVTFIDSIDLGNFRPLPLLYSQSLPNKDKLFPLHTVPVVIAMCYSLLWLAWTSHVHIPRTFGLFLSTQMDKALMEIL